MHAEIPRETRCADYVLRRVFDAQVPEAEKRAASFRVRARAQRACAARADDLPWCVRSIAACAKSEARAFFLTDGAQRGMAACRSARRCRRERGVRVMVRREARPRISFFFFPSPRRATGCGVRADGPPPAPSSRPAAACRLSVADFLMPFARAAS